MSTQERQTSSPQFSFDYKMVAQQVFLVWNFPPTCKPHKYPNKSFPIYHFVCTVVSHSVTPWTSLSTGFSRQEYWSGVLVLTPEHLPDPEIELESLVSPALAGGFFTTGPPVKSHIYHFQSCLTLWPYGLQHARLPCPSPTSKLSIQLDGDAIQPSHSVVPFSSCLQSFPASGSFPMSQFFDSGGQSIRVSASASVFPVNIQDWFPLELTGLISLQSKGLSRVISNTLPLAKFFSALRHKGLWCCTSSKPLKWHLTASSKCRDSTSTTWH